MPEVWWKCNAGCTPTVTATFREDGGKPIITISHPKCGELASQIPFSKWFNAPVKPQHLHVPISESSRHGTGHGGKG